MIWSRKRSSPWVVIASAAGFRFFLRVDERGRHPGLGSRGRRLDVLQETDPVDRVGVRHIALGRPSAVTTSRNCAVVVAAG